MPVTPVPVAQQREALNVLTREVFSSGSFRFDPDFMSKLGVDHLDRFLHRHGADAEHGLQPGEQRARDPARPRSTS